MIDVSIVVATFNSARLLPLVLASIRKQTYPQNKIEILIVDGGSSDSTLEIAKNFHCRVIANKKVEPLYAKYLGYMHAKGRYIIYIDHDEVLRSHESIATKVQLLQENPSVKAVIGNGYRSPRGYNIINRYINEFGDPFSFFIYRLSKNADFFLATMRRKYSVVQEGKECTIFDLSSNPAVPIIELAAGGGMIDGRFFKSTFPKIKTHYHLIAHLLHILRPSHPMLAIMKNDALLHYSSDSVAAYINKIIWRIKNNIFYTQTIGASGFTGREEYQTPMRRLKKFSFVPYAFSIVLPFLDSLYLMATRKDAAYAIHLPLTVVTACLILYYSVLKLIGVKLSLTSYDGSVRAYEKI